MLKGNVEIVTEFKIVTPLRPAGGRGRFGLQKLVGNFLAARSAVRPR